MKLLGPYLTETAQAEQMANTILDILMDGESFWQKAGVPKPTKTKLLGSGANGAAYDIGGGKVLKITRDETEAETSAYVYKKGGIPGVIKIFGVYESNNMPGVYMLILEKVKMDGMKAHSAWKELDYAIDEVREDQKAASDASDRSTASGTRLTWRDTSFTTSTYQDKRNLTAIVSKLKNKDSIELANTMHRLTKAGVEFNDMHPGNIGFSGSKPVILDLGMSSSPAGKIQTFERRLNEVVVRLSNNPREDTKKIALFADELAADLKDMFGMTAGHEKIKMDVHQPEEATPDLWAISMRSGSFKTIHVWFSGGKLTMVTVGGKRIMVRSKTADSEQIAKIIYKESR